MTTLAIHNARVIDPALGRDGIADVVIVDGRVARVGPNEIHVYLFDRRDGSQYDETKELTVTAELPEKRIEPIELDASKAGPGHYVISGAALAPEGEWTLEIAARVTEFDEFRTKLEVPVR